MRLPSNEDEENLDPIDDNTPILDFQHAKTSKPAPVILLCQGSAAISTKIKVMRAQNQDAYSLWLQMMVGSDLTWLCNGNGMLCKRSTVDGSIQAIVSQKYRGVVPHHVYYPKPVGHLGV